MDLSGKLVIKATLGDDIRRIPIHNEDITYDELILMMQRVFRDQVSPSDDVALKYKDEDGDLVTLYDSADLATALQISRILKLTVFVNGKIPGSNKGLISTDVKIELRAIRDKINHILDSLDGVENGGGGPAVSDLATSVQDLKIQSTNNGGNSGTNGDSNANASTASELANGNSSFNNQAAAVQESKEFDPLQQQQQIKVEPPPQTIKAEPQISTPKLPDDQVSVSSSISSRDQTRQPDVTAAAYQQQQYQAYPQQQPYHPQQQPGAAAPTPGAQQQQQPPPPSSTPQPMYPQQPHPNQQQQQYHHQQHQQYSPRPPTSGAYAGQPMPGGAVPPPAANPPATAAAGMANTMGYGQMPPSRQTAPQQSGPPRPPAAGYGAWDPNAAASAGAAVPAPNPYTARPAGPPNSGGYAAPRFPFTR